MSCGLICRNRDSGSPDIEGGAILGTHSRRPRWTWSEGQSRLGMDMFYSRNDSFRADNPADYITLLPITVNEKLDQGLMSVFTVLSAMGL
jgi:hypothetical protein